MSRALTSPLLRGERHFRAQPGEGTEKPRVIPPRALCVSGRRACASRMAPMTRLLPLLLLAACATQQPAEYKRGTYRPAPPTFSPTQDAPHTVGQPGHVAQPQAYPRSPHKRPLPPTKEPGLWAGAKPKASASKEPTLLGVRLPYPKQASTDADKYPVQRCAETMGAAIAHLAATASLLKLPPNAHRPCAAAVLLLQCLREDSEAALRAKRKGRGDAGELERYERSEVAALDFFSRECGKRMPTEAEVEYYEAVIREWQSIKELVQ